MGGCDILMTMHQDGSLAKMLEERAYLQRWKSRPNRSCIRVEKKRQKSYTFQRSHEERFVRLAIVFLSTDCINAKSKWCACGTCRNVALLFWKSRSWSGCGFLLYISSFRSVTRSTGSHRSSPPLHPSFSFFHSFAIRSVGHHGKEA